jgi:hypothetical protein
MLNWRTPIKDVARIRSQKVEHQGELTINNQITEGDANEN